jgi:hypothetical protein
MTVAFRGGSSPNDALDMSMIRVPVTRAASMLFEERNNEASS